MKVLMLDIDGVVNHLPGTPCTKGKTGRMVMTDPEKVFMLNRAVDEHGFGAVLSSSWRHAPDWRESMREQGFVFEFLDRTPLKTKNSRCRGDNVREWLEGHPEVTRYAILDDESDFLPEQREHLFRCKTQVGLTQEIMDDVVKYLMRDK